MWLLLLSARPLVRSTMRRVSSTTSCRSRRPTTRNSSCPFKLSSRRVSRNPSSNSFVTLPKRFPPCRLSNNFNINSNSNSNNSYIYTNSSNNNNNNQRSSLTNLLITINSNNSNSCITIFNNSSSNSNSNSNNSNTC